MNQIDFTGLFRYLLHRLNVYSRPGLLLRIGLDLVAANAGMFVGALFTITMWIDNPIIPRDYFQVMFFRIWLENVPLVTLSCLAGYGMTGLYGVTRENRFRKIALAVTQAVTTALLIRGDREDNEGRPISVGSRSGGGYLLDFSGGRSLSGDFALSGSRHL